MSSNQDNKLVATPGQASPLPEASALVLRPISAYLSDSQMVKVLVGPERKTWILHENLLCHRSLFFRESLGGSSEGQREQLKEIYIEDEDPAAFTVFVDWVYGSPVAAIFNFSFKGICPEETKRGEKEEAAKLFLLWDVYLLAESLDIEKLHNEVMDVFIAHANVYDPLYLAESIYSQTTTGAKIRKFISRYTAWAMFNDELGKGLYDQYLIDIPEFAFDVLMAAQDSHLSGTAYGNHQTPEPVCKYHTHHFTPKCE